MENKRDTSKRTILTINAGSSSIKFALFKAAHPFTQVLGGSVENIGSKKSTLVFHNIVTQQKKNTPVNASGQEQAIMVLMDCLAENDVFSNLAAIGHRIVHGMQHILPEKITPELLKELKQISIYDPEHLPGEIKLVELFGHHYPSLVQIACFDTAFHAAMPAVAKMMAIPRRYYNKGIHRYGFHGLSYAYLMQELDKMPGQQSVPGKIILAHLGSGASVAAVKDGKSVDTTMGFTPSSGLPMSTRSGDLDPGVAWYLMKFEKLNPQQFSHMINHESGLLGVSETSADVRTLIECRDTDRKAAEAIELFCYQVKKTIGSYAAVLGGLHTLVFSGGIGEHSPLVRSKICDGLEFLGIELDEIANMNNEAIISAAAGKVVVRIIKTNEEIMIACMVCDILNESGKDQTST